MPALYLAALINHYASQNGSLLETSFATYTDGFKWLPDTYTEESPVVFMGAVLDVPESVLENPLWAHTEPLQSYTKAVDLGVVLVGAEIKDGVSFGMTSQKGAVSCAGYAGGGTVEKAVLHQAMRWEQALRSHKWGRFFWLLRACGNREVNLSQQLVLSDGCFSPVRAGSVRRQIRLCGCTKIRLAQRRPRRVSNYTWW